MTDDTTDDGVDRPEWLTDAIDAYDDEEAQRAEELAAEFEPTAATDDADPTAVGTPATGATADTGKSPGVAAALSLLWPGLGQLYSGEYLRAGGFFLAGVATFMLIFVAIGVLLYPFVAVAAAFDAYATAADPDYPGGVAA